MPRHRTMTSLLLALVSALLLPLALPNDLHRWGSPLVGLVALAPLFAGVVLAPSFRAASGVGVVFGAVSTFLAHYWLAFFREFSAWTVCGVVLGYAAYHALLAPILRGVALRLAGVRPLALASTWTVYEYVKSSGFLGFPWGLVSHPFNTLLPAIQIAGIYGVWAVSLLAAAASALAAEPLLAAWGAPMPRQRARACAGVVAVMVAFSVGYGVWRLNGAPAESGRFAVALIQHNADPWTAGNDDATVSEVQELTRRALAAGPVDLVVWSETIVPHLVREAQLARLLERFPRPVSLSAFLREIRTPLLLGAPLEATGGSGYQNAALLLSPDGRLLGRYGKQQLVPFAERVPLWHLEAVRRFFQGALGLTQGWTPGAGPTVLSAPLAGGGAARLGTPICFEDAFPDLCRRLVRAGARVLVNLTNVSWSRRESAMLQMIVAARFRAVENGCALVRATNGGMTAIIDARGRIVSALPLFEPAFLRAHVPLSMEAGNTPYARFGDLLPRLLAVVLVLALAFAAAKQRGRPA